MFGPFRKKLARGKALKMYKRGLEKAEDRNFDGAISDYTLILDMPHAPVDVKAMARFNRALAHSSNRKYALANQDLRAVLSAHDTPEQVKEAARAKLNRLQRRIDEAGESEE